MPSACDFQARTSQHFSPRRTPAARLKPLLEPVFTRHSQPSRTRRKLLKRNGPAYRYPSQGASCETCDLIACRSRLAIQAGSAEGSQLPCR